jgi:regulator of ribonuclease activity A
LTTRSVKAPSAIAYSNRVKPINLQEFNMMPSTPDLADHYGDRARVLPPIFTAFGGREAFDGPAVTIACFEDNSKVKELAGGPGHGQVMVVDGGGSTRRALLGDQIAAQAAANGWAGVIIYGAVRDVEILRTIDLGIKALAAIPVKTHKLGAGTVGQVVNIAGVVISPGDHVYADASGVLIVESTEL